MIGNSYRQNRIPGQNRFRTIGRRNQHRECPQIDFSTHMLVVDFYHITQVFLFIVQRKQISTRDFYIRYSYDILGIIGIRENELAQGITMRILQVGEICWWVQRISVAKSSCLKFILAVIGSLRLSSPRRERIPRGQRIVLMFLAYRGSRDSRFSRCIPPMIL